MSLSPHHYIGCEAAAVEWTERNYRLSLRPNNLINFIPSIDQLKEGAQLIGKIDLCIEGLSPNSKCLDKYLNIKNQLQTTMDGLIEKYYPEYSY